MTFPPPLAQSVPSLNKCALNTNSAACPVNLVLAKGEGTRPERRGRQLTPGTFFWNSKIICTGFTWLLSSISSFKPPTSIKSQEAREGGWGATEWTCPRRQDSLLVSLLCSPEWQPEKSPLFQAAPRQALLPGGLALPTPPSSHPAPRCYLCVIRCSPGSSKFSSLVCGCQTPRKGSPHSHSPAGNQEVGEGNSTQPGCTANTKDTPLLLFLKASPFSQ